MRNVQMKGMAVAAVVTFAGTVLYATNVPEIVLIPRGEFVMGDHFNYTDPDHPTDELPQHTVQIDTLYLGKYDVTNLQYCDYLNSALGQGLIEVRNGLVYAVGGSDTYCETRSSTLYGIVYSGIVWNGSTFSVQTGRDNHPTVGVRWEGAVAYCNWLSTFKGYETCYNLTTWACDFTKNGYRLPTEAEWEYAANGGRYYDMFPWGDDPNTGGLLANWENSGDPYETGDYPWTTPVGFYNGQLHAKADFGWPGSQISYQTSNGVNGYGLYDMAGNVWQWTNDWYGKAYYSASPASNPTGPTTGDPMPDGKPYRVLRGGNWFNGAQYYGHSRIANRDPAYYRGPQDPNHPYYHVGFRVALHTTSLVQPDATLTSLMSGLQFGEGPAADSQGNVFFSDVAADTIHEWPLSGNPSVFRTSSGGANGLFVDKTGNVVACESDNGRVVSISTQGVVTVLAAQYNGKRFNEPNDLWIDAKGGIYFTDPVFWGTLAQDGQHVYYISSDRSTVTRVISDMTKPNGLIGTPDGTTLYVSDYGAGATWRYTVNADGTLSNKTLFVGVGSDGMELDDEGNVYLTTDTNGVVIYSSAGAQIQTIATPERPTNLCFGGSDRRTLFITTQHGLYSIRLRVQGPTQATMVDAPPTIARTTRSPAVPTASDAVWVTAAVTDDSSVSSVKLTYSTGTGTGTTSTVFTETMCSTAVKPWTGAGAVNAWTVTGSYCEQRTGSNYGTGNVCGLEYKSGTTLNGLTAAMVTATNAINAAGTSGYVEFWLQSLTLDGTDGWTFQLDSGSGFVTRLSELTGNSHGWQKYHYDLAASELIATLKMRFQFTGGGPADDDRIDLDQITVTVTSGGTSSWTVSMLDDGVHGDGNAGDGRYGAQIPAGAVGATVSYYVTATDDGGNTSSDPATAPAQAYSYTVASAPIDRTVGLLVNTPGAFQGYTLMAPMHYTKTYLINNQGRVVHTWSSAYEPGRTAYLLENGHLMRACMLKGGVSTGGGEGGRIEEYDWDGNLVWEFNYATTDYMAHHDFKVLPNGNVIMLVVEKRTYAEVIAAGFNPSLLDPEISSEGYMLPDSVIEVQPTRPVGGTIVWQWRVWDHLIQDYSSTKANYGVVASHPELVNANGTGAKIPQFWNHMNSIGYNPDLDQISLSVRGNSELWVIDHQTTTAQAAGHTGGRYGKGGDLLYRWGNPLQYKIGTAASQMLLQQHDTEWIPAGRPGAGNILIYNNGIGRGYSTVDEIVPPVDAAGNYSRSSGTAFGPSTLYWTYRAPTPADFYSAEISGAQRLPNGNTLICEGVKGNLFEVTSAGEIVWRYMCPVTDTGPLSQGDSIPVDPVRADQYMNAVFQVDRYAADYTGLVGRDLTPGGTIELPTTVVPADFNGDGDVDSDDFSLFLSCLSGPTIPYSSGCADKDFDHDGDVDQADFGVFQRCISGTGVAADPTCAE